VCLYSSGHSCTSLATTPRQTGAFTFGVCLPRRCHQARSAELRIRRSAKDPPIDLSLEVRLMEDQAGGRKAASYPMFMPRSGSNRAAQCFTIAISSRRYSSVTKNRTSS
jgi:hypothetical protein